MIAQHSVAKIPDEIEISIVVPVFNEEEAIAPLMERITQAMSDFGDRYELIIVDDGSVDRTLVNARAEIEKYADTIRLVEMSRNFGQTAAMQAGIDLARGRLIATLDGDLQNDPDDIPLMAKELDERGLDLLVGWRRDRQDALFLRKIPSWSANFLIGKVTGVKLHDYGCSLKIYRASVIKKVRLMGEMHRFIPAWVAGVVPSSRIGEMVVTHYSREFGTSKYGISRTFRVILDLLSVLFFMRYKARPGHFFGSIGLVLGGLSVVIFVYLGIVKFAYGEDIGTRPMLIFGIMTFLASLQMITTGILAEMMARTSNRTEGNTGYHIREVFSRNDAE